MKSYWQSPHQIPDKTYDLIIVGAGIAGLSVAFWASKLNLDILVIERGELGAGASGRNAGFLTGGSLNYFVTLLNKYGQEKALSLWQFTTENVALMKSELKLLEHASQLEYHESGTISLFKKEEDLDEIENAYQILKENQFDIKKVKAILGFEAAYKINSDASYNPLKVIHLLSEKLSSVSFATHTDVLHFSKVHNQYEIETNRGVLKSRQIVFATNAFLRKNLPIFENVIKPARAQMAYFKLDANALSFANHSIPSERIYFRRYGEGLMIGGLRFLDEDNEKTDQLALNATIQEALYQRAKNYFGEAKLLQKWSGIMGMTSDEQPIYGALKADTGILYIGGFSGHGNGYAFKMAKNLIDEYLKDMV